MGPKLRGGGDQGGQETASGWPPGSEGSDEEEVVDQVVTGLQVACDRFEAGADVGRCVSNLDASEP